MNTSDADSTPRYVRGPQLRKRWGGMSNSSFYEKRRKGVIPEPVYPFGPEVPYWLLSEIEELERKAACGSMFGKGRGRLANVLAAPEAAAAGCDRTPGEQGKP